MQTSDFPTFNKEWDKSEIKKKTKKILKEIGELQHKMYAQGKYSMIVVLQGDRCIRQGRIDPGASQILRPCWHRGAQLQETYRP